MNHRSWDEIQGNSQIPEGYSEQEEKNYSALVPTYSHTSVYKECGSSYTVSVDGVRIYYNDVYSYGGSVYHRDNYCMVPIKVPPMTLKNESYALDHETVVKLIPKVSEEFGLEYDYTFITEHSMVDIVIAAYAGYDQKLNIGYCICDDLDTNFEIVPGTSITELEGPLDHMVVTVPDISDEYAYIWEDLWDLGTFNTTGGGGRRYPPKDDSSSSTQPPPTGAVYLCRIDVPPTGNGGTATVSIISVSGSGAVQVGGSLVVNVPSI